MYIYGTLEKPIWGKYAPPQKGHSKSKFHTYFFSAADFSITKGTLSKMSTFSFLPLQMKQ
jgi:hypothetical protein